LHGKLFVRKYQLLLSTNISSPITNIILEKLKNDTWGKIK